MANKDNDLRKKIKKNIGLSLKQKNINKYKIYLFGSRAREEEIKDSDFDIMILVDKNLTDSEKLNLYGKIRLGLMEFRYSFDVIIKSFRDFEKEENTFGTLSYSIKHEAILL